MNFDKVPEIDHSHPRRWVRVRRILLPVLIGAAVLAFGAGGWWLLRLRRESTRQERAAGREELVARLRDCEHRLDAAGDSVEERLPVLEEGVAVLRDLVLAQGGRSSPHSRDLEEWQRRLADAKAEGLLAQSRAAEAAADVAAARGDIDGAAAGYREASRLQRVVNNSEASSQLTSYSRETMLAQKADKVAVEPRAVAVRQAMSTAEVAEATGDAVRALAEYRRARELQLAINQDFPDSAYANRAEAERLESLIASLGAAELDAQVRALIASAGAAVGDERFEEAGRRLAEAGAVQARINDEHAKSRFASVARLEEIEALRQTALAGRQFREIAALDAGVARHLRRREVYQAQQLLQQAVRRLDEVAAAQPRARPQDEELRQRLSFLHVRTDDIVGIQDRVHALLRPLPGTPGAALLAVEVPQPLFAQVMNTNPSANAGKDLPVDSVTFDEAREFCRRLGWIMGAEVRLPTRAELTVAAGADGTVWSAENSGGQPHPPGAGSKPSTGCADIRGNLAEWIGDAGGPDGTAAAAGGSFATPLAEMQDALPVRTLARSERSREVGFRVVVAADPAAK